MATARPHCSGPSPACCIIFFVCVAAHATAASVATAAASARATVTPLQKVIELVTNLKQEVEAEGVTEAQTYDQFACFCREKTKTLSTSITGGQDTIDQRSATIEEKTAEKGDKARQLAATRKEKEQLHADLDAEVARCAKERAEFDASDADLRKAVSSLEGAIAALEDAKPSASLVNVRQTVKKSLALAEAMKLVEAGPKWGTLTAFVQEGAKVDPSDPEYKYHSQGIIGVLQKLLEEFRARKAQADAEWGKTSSVCSDSKTNLNRDIGIAGDTISALETSIEGLATEIGTARRELVEADERLKDDELYLSDLTSMCQQRATDWDQRSTTRSEELMALTKALGLLAENVAAAEEANERALLLQKGAPKPLARAKPAASAGVAKNSPKAKALDAVPSFVQRGLLSRARGGRRPGRGGGKLAAEESPEEATKGQALALLEKEGRRLGSMALSTLAARVAADPFLKVKTLIQQLVERLQQEATDEATKKGFCDMELSKAEQDRDYRMSSVKKLDAEVQTLEAKEDALSFEINELTASIEQLSTDLGQAQAIRANETEQNLATVSQAKEGLEALTTAIQILKVFYKKASRAQVLVQQGKRASPLDEDTAGAGFEGAYKGKQTASKGIIGMLEVIKSDFMRTIKVTDAAEEDSRAKFEDFAQASKADISGQTTKKELDDEDLTKTQAKLRSTMEDLQRNQDFVDSAIKRLEELKPTCIDTGMSYAERVQKREDEIAALRRALCILDQDGVEPECGQQQQPPPR